MNEKQKAEAYVRRELNLSDEKCPVCEGHGKELCNNPDHGFIHSMPGDIGRLGCPVCGHDEYFRTKYDCNVCKGTGVNEPKMNDWLRVLKENSGNPFKLDMYGNLIALNMLMNEIVVMKFDLQTGQPATEADYQAFNQIVGI